MKTPKPNSDVGLRDVLAWQNVSRLAPKLLAATVAMAFVLPTSVGATIYVETTGSDLTLDCRKPETPCKSLARALREASFGERISMGEGRFPGFGYRIDRNLEIVGRGHRLTIIEGAANRGEAEDRIFTIEELAELSLSGVSVCRGNAIVEGDHDGGGIHNRGRLRLFDVEISDNDAGPGGRGGGVFNERNARLLARIAALTGNQAGAGAPAAGGIPPGGGDGGAICNFGEIVASRLSIYNNLAGNGGNGIFNGGNGGTGGGVFNGNGGAAEFVNTNISGNAAGDGGNALGGGMGIGGTAGNGGGFSSTNTAIKFDFCTIANNRAGNGGTPSGGHGTGGGGFNNSAATTVALSHCILFGNSVAAGRGGSDFAGTLNGGGHNLIGDLDSINDVGIVVGNLHGQDPLLDPLDFFDWPPSHPLAAGSPALNAGDPNLLNPPLIDLRGFLRRFNRDLGAFERGGGKAPDDDGDLIPNVLDGDTDDDGMSDDWEQANGLIVGEDDSGGDKDGDGFTNGEEFDAQTDPCSELSWPRLNILDLDHENQTADIELSPTVPGRFYTLARGGVGSSSWDPVEGHTNVEATGDSIIFDDVDIQASINSSVFRALFNQPVDRFAIDP